jgi:hypothetical protein
VNFTVPTKFGARARGRQIALALARPLVLTLRQIVLALALLLALALALAPCAHLRLCTLALALALGTLSFMYADNPLNIKGITRLSSKAILNRSCQTDIVFWEMMLINFASVGVNWFSNHAGRNKG